MTALARSNRADVRNPVLALPAMQGLLDLPPDQRQTIERLLRDLSADAAERAQKAWKTHKAPMALYWKCVAVYAGHLARAMGRGR
jgi:hypothetical protein